MKYYAIKSIISDDLSRIQKKVSKQPEISIFPIPTSDILNVIYLGEDELNRLKLFDLNGSKIMEKINVSNELQLNLSFLQNGTYILILFSDKRQFVNKIIKTSATFK